MSSYTMKKNLEFALNWPGVAVSINGKIYQPEKASVPTNPQSQEFRVGPLRFIVSLQIGKDFIRKNVLIRSDEALPTPDFVDVDFQQLPDSELEVRGYQPSYAKLQRRTSSEESSGVLPGCGYPLIGKRFFVGLEHPGAFNEITAPGSYRLRQHPIWHDNCLQCAPVMLGWGENSELAFQKYLQKIRLPRLKKPLFSFCTFWSDPHLGNGEFKVSTEAYLSYARAFASLGLKPDVITLDAGWQNRQSILEPKSEVDLKRLQGELQKLGINLSLWTTNNGPVGIDPEYLKKAGFSVGGGLGAHYSGNNFAVLMDEKLEERLTQRLVSLVGAEAKAVHFKIDWDNECATAPEFQEKYPTRNHVREATLNVIIRICSAARKVAPKIIFRNGHWPSPWWLLHSGHLSLSDGGDSEYASLPSWDQRNAAATHRDLMYYNILQRDKSALPLDCFDNHEFPEAPRNPFTKSPSVSSDIAWLAILRGSTYLPWKLQPESLEPWQAEMLQEIMKFARSYARKIFVSQGRMVGGHPGRGEVYGFLQSGDRESWCLLRNPMPLPQRFQLKSTILCENSCQQILQMYPCFQELDNEICLPAHGVIVMQLRQEKMALPCPGPFQPKGRKIFLPNSQCPGVDKLYQAPELAIDLLVSTENECMLKVRSPYRMRNFQLYIRLSGAGELRLLGSRYSDGNTSNFAMPVTECFSSPPGYGEAKNPDGIVKLNSRFFSSPLPSGGEVYLRLLLHHAPLDPANLELWVSGFEAPARSAAFSATLAGFSRGLPPQHPLGFPRLQKLDWKR